jgi:hypothetical protein
MKSRTLMAGCLGVLVASGAVAMFSPLAPPDFTSLPPKGADVERELRASSVKLAKAIEVAEQVVGGVAKSAAIDLNATPPIVEVMAYGDGSAHRVTVDFKSGSVSNVDVVPRFPGDPVDGDWTETPSGLKYFEIVEGEGPQPMGPSARVKVHYTGWFVNGEKFDSSVDRGQPATFPLNGVIAGWTEGVGDMRVGGKRKLIIPYDLAYGERGRAPRIPAKATLIFDVELLELVE